jgi:hypothetical protein
MAFSLITCLQVQLKWVSIDAVCSSLPLFIHGRLASLLLAEDVTSWGEREMLDSSDLREKRNRKKKKKSDIELQCIEELGGALFILVFLSSLC